MSEWLTSQRGDMAPKPKTCHRLFLLDILVLLELPKWKEDFFFLKGRIESLVCWQGEGQEERQNSSPEKATEFFN